MEFLVRFDLMNYTARLIQPYYMASDVNNESKMYLSQ